MSHVNDAIPTMTMSAVIVMKVRIAGASIPEVSPQMRARMWY
jgi:hypothetical protein